MNIKSPSPDQNHLAELLYEDEIRFGPAYFRLQIDGRPVPGRLFGSKLFWSPDSRYLAAEEWLTTDYGAGPMARLLLIDVPGGRAAAFEIITKGFVKEVQFTVATVSYVGEFPATGKASVAEVDPSSIKDWSNLG